jgi:hypothetical protein
MDSGGPLDAPEPLESPEGRVDGARSSKDQLEGDCSADALRVIEVPIEQLRVPSLFAECGIEVSAASLTAESQRGELAYRDLINISTDYTVLDGYPLLKLAQMQHRPTVLCRRHALSEREQLLWIVQKLQSPSWVNDYLHALAALRLKASWRAIALANQQLGGKLKGSVDLQEADRVDVFGKIAEEIGISATRLRRVDFLERKAAPEVRAALRKGEIRIDRAWRWIRFPHEKQCEELERFRERKGIKRAIREMLTKHRPTKRPLLIDVKEVLNDLLLLLRAAPASIQLEVVKVEGKVVILTEELFQVLSAVKSNGKERSR